MDQPLQSQKVELQSQHQVKQKLKRAASKQCAEEKSAKAVNKVIPNWFVRDLKWRAYRDEIKYDLQYDELVALFQSQGGQCHYTGEKIYFGARDKKMSERQKLPVGNVSLDRTFSDKPYTISNVRFVTKIANLSKQETTPDSFVNNCKKVVEYHIKKMKIEHSELVSSLAKSGTVIAEELQGGEAHLLHMAVGISGEAGELLDAIKKNAIYRKPLDMENVIEELGDLEFYLEGIRQGVGVTREECLQANIAKLSKRYATLKYSDQAAQERADKV